MKKLFLSAFAIIALSALSFGQLVTATAQANVAQGFGISNGKTLNFGSFAVTADGSITQDVIGSVPTGLGFKALGLNNEGSFSVSGPAGKNFQVTMPKADIKLNKQTGTADFMTIPFGSWTTDLGTGNVGQIAAGNTTYTFSVGATLEFLATQLPGQYSGSYDVTVAYE